MNGSGKRTSQVYLQLQLKPRLGPVLLPQLVQEDVLFIELPLNVPGDLTRFGPGEHQLLLHPGLVLVLGRQARGRGVAPQAVPGARAAVPISAGWGHVLQDPPPAVSETAGAGAGAALLPAVEHDRVVGAVESVAGQSPHGAGAR